MPWISFVQASKIEEGYFEPPFETTSFLPRGSAPSFTIAAGAIPTGGGRDCTFRLIASGEDDLGNSIGSTIHSFDITLTGGLPGLAVSSTTRSRSTVAVTMSVNDLLEVGCVLCKATLALTDGTLSISSSVSGVTLTPASGNF